MIYIEEVYNFDTWRWCVVIELVAEVECTLCGRKFVCTSDCKLDIRVREDKRPEGLGGRMWSDNSCPRVSAN